MAQQNEILVTNAAGGTHLDVSPMESRRFVLISNYGPNPLTIFLGTAAAGVVATGIHVPAATAGVPGILGPIEVPKYVPLWALAATAAQLAGAATVLTEW